MNKLPIEVFKREKIGKEGSKKVRKEGLVPTVIYGKEFEPISIKINPSEIRKILVKYGANVLLELQSKELPDLNNKIAIIKELQKHPISRNILHIDLLRINENEKIEIEVPIKITGKSEGEKKGGVKEILLRHLRIKCLPFDIPEFIEVDITELDLGKVYHVKDLEVPEGIELNENPEEAIISVFSPHEEEIEEEEEEGVAEEVAEDKEKSE